MNSLSPLRKQRKMDLPVPTNSEGSANNITLATDMQKTAVGEQLNSSSTSGDSNTSLNGIMFALERTDYETIVETTSFVDKTLLIKQLFDYPKKEISIKKIPMKKVLIMAPTRFGKTTNMEMVKAFLNILVDKEGKERINVTYDKQTRKWIEKQEEELTSNYKLFKTNNLHIYQCYHNPKHSDEECENGICEDRQFFYKNCGTHPVIHVDFKGVSCETKEELLNSLTSALRRAFLEHKYLEKSNLLREDQKKAIQRYYSEGEKELSIEDIKIGLARLSQYLYEHFDKRVFVLIDEFDAPILDLLAGTTNSGKQVTVNTITNASNFIGKVISALLKSNDEFVEGALLNACYRLSGVLSPLGVNIQDYSFMYDHEFAVYYGFTQAEVNVLLNKPEFTGINRNNITEYYNGYEIYGQKTKMYSTYSLIKCLQEWCKTDGRSSIKGFWADRFGMQNLVQLLFSHDCIRNKFYKLVANGQVDIRVQTEKVSPEDVYHLISLINGYVISDDDIDLFFLFLTDYGYLNVVEQNEEEWTLKIPNKEISIDLGRKFFKASMRKSKHLFSGMIIKEFIDAIKALERGKRETFQRFTNSVASLYSDKNVPEPESQAELQGPLFTFVLDMLTSKTRVELYCQKYRKFRLDHIIVRNDGTGIILELKVNQDSARAGLKQIFTSEYYKVFKQYNITKDKIFIGLHYKNRKVTISALATDKDSIIETFDMISENELIELVSD